jgi:uncharacterized protein (TIGR02996 family)
MSDQESSFIEAIQRAEEPDPIRLAYAGWLEQRGDVRAEVLRLTAELSQIWERYQNEGRQSASPIVADIARIKIRLRELQQETAAEWWEQIMAPRDWLRRRLSPDEVSILDVGGRVAWDSGLSGWATDWEQVRAVLRPGDEVWTCHLRQPWEGRGYLEIVRHGAVVARS